MPANMMSIKNNQQMNPNKTITR